MEGLQGLRREVGIASMVRTGMRMAMRGIGGFILREGLTCFDPVKNA
jgi:hypothetical protein